MSTLSDIEKYLLLLKTKQQYLQTHASDLEQRHTTLALSIELTTIAIEQVSCTGLWNVPTICPTSYCVPPYVLPPKPIHYAYRFISSKPYPVMVYEALAVTAIPLNGTLCQILRSYDMGTEALNIGAIPLNGTLRSILRTTTYGYDYANNATYEALNITSVPLDGSLRQILRTHDLETEALNISAIPLNGALEVILITQDQPFEALNISAIPLNGTLS